MYVYLYAVWMLTVPSSLNSEYKEVTELIDKEHVACVACIIEYATKNEGISKDKGGPIRY